MKSVASLSPPGGDALRETDLLLQRQVHGQDVNTKAQPYDHCFANSGSNLRHQHMKAVFIDS